MEMRRNERKMENEETLKILSDGLYGILSTIGEDNQPYGVPMSYVVVDDYIYYHGTNAGGKKYNNVIYNNKVSFTVVGKTQVLPDKFGTLYESAIVFGVVSLVEDESEKLMAFKAFLNKYCADYMPEGEKYIESAGSKTYMYKIAIKEFTGKHRVK